MGPLNACVDRYWKEAEELLKKGALRQLVFAQGTYQLEVKERGRIYAPFFQFEGDRLKDYFCSCQKSEGCIHLAAGLLAIYRGQAEPLHMRFYRSLWNRLSELTAELFGYDRVNLNRTEAGVWECGEGKKRFFARATHKKGQTKLAALLSDRETETEETSLKFSQLSAQDLKLWHEGRPPTPLLYELSLWADLAKELMLSQDRGDGYEIIFEWSETGLPDYLTAIFPDLTVGFPIPAASLASVIPTLESVRSPLAVYRFEQAIEGITYDPLSGCLKVLSQAPRWGDLSGARPIGDWLYVAGRGFYSRRQHRLLLEPVICDPDELNRVLTEEGEFLARHLRGVHIHRDPIAPSWQLRFDSRWNLHIEGYIRTPGDLQRPLSRSFGDWVYIEGDGFYPWTGEPFPESSEEISAQEVSEFVSHNKVWLNGQEGFHTHLSSMPLELTYRFDAQETLIFESRVDVTHGFTQAVCDFGEWVYLAGQGFFSKVGPGMNAGITPGLKVPSKEIAAFVRRHHEELELVKGFFTASQPLTRAGLKVQLITPEEILVTPHYEIASGYATMPLRFFGDLIYIPHEGFAELALAQRLPRRFHEPVTIHEDLFPFFFSYELETLLPYLVDPDPRLCTPQQLALIAADLEPLQKDPRHGVCAALGYVTEYGRVAVSAIWQVIQERKRYHFSPAGLIDCHDNAFGWIGQFSEGQIKDEEIVLSTLELIRLHLLQGLIPAPENAKASALFHELTSLKTSREPHWTGLKSHLRPYQETGVRWLWSLFQHGLSGLLCDDMGLGKTHQAMALMAAVREESKEARYPAAPAKNFLSKNDTEGALFRRPASPTPREGLSVSCDKKSHASVHFARENFLVGTAARYLVVCPKSVIYHWQDKLEGFLPGLRVYIFHGTERDLEEFKAGYDLLLTSYGMVRICREHLAEVPFTLGIFDEIQVAKNPQSQTHKALLALKIGMRLGLTGTPIENNLIELKALFDVSVPGYMPSPNQYRRLFLQPIEKEGNAKAKALLSRFIRPFVLRRKKSEVLTDLPEKIEELAHYALSEEQRVLYDGCLAQSRETLFQALQKEGEPIPYMHIFAVLSALKQICDHPAVYRKDPAHFRDSQSGKWDLALELLYQARDSGQKVVIFSQYLHMLDIFEAHLRDQNIGFATIRGATVHRDEEMRRFQNDPTCEVFLGSLQAAGLGIDLTAASVVIHYDRWWNPARENQATDRVHRIGQTRGVQVFKLVAKGTIEERIDAIITRKTRLLDQIVASDDQDQLKQLNRSELLELLQFVYVEEESSTEGTNSSSSSRE